MDVLARVVVVLLEVVLDVVVGGGLVLEVGPVELVLLVVVTVEVVDVPSWTMCVIHAGAGDQPTVGEWT